MVLSNAPDVFSCGEIVALFRPYRFHHARPHCGCGDATCNLWSDLRRVGETRVYSRLFEQFPEISTIVDSSKNPLWIAEMTEQLAKDGIATKNVLIWKTPLDFRQSRIKRGRHFGWQRSWRNYHRLYFRLIPSWVSVEYGQLVRDPLVLGQLCDHLGLGHRQNRERYWEKVHHTLFGNASAKVHLYRPGSDNYLLQKSELAHDERSPALSAIAGATVSQAVSAAPVSISDAAAGCPRALLPIVQVLKQFDFQETGRMRPITLSARELNQVRATAIDEMLRRIRWHAQRLTIGRLIAGMSDS
jgi:hypothetical protein